jgi:hypothetical protein
VVSGASFRLNAPGFFTASRDIHFERYRDADVLAARQARIEPGIGSREQRFHQNALGGECSAGCRARQQDLCARFRRQAFGAREGVEQRDGAECLKGERPLHRARYADGAATVFSDCNRHHRIDQDFFRAQGCGNGALDLAWDQASRRNAARKHGQPDLTLGAHTHAARQFRRAVYRDRHQVVGANFLRGQVNHCGFNALGSSDSRQAHE